MHPPGLHAPPGLMLPTPIYGHNGPLAPSLLPPGAVLQLSTACHPVWSDLSAVTTPEMAYSATWGNGLRDADTNSAAFPLVGSSHFDGHIPCGPHAIWLVDGNPCCLPCF